MNNKTALLVMDMQMGITSRLPQQGEVLINKVADAIKAAREKNILVIFVRVGFRRGMPEVSPNNKSFSAMKGQMTDAQLEAFMQIHPKLEMSEKDILVNKKRVSAFSGSDLEMILRANDIAHLILTGIATSGIVLSTIREAFDKDYQQTVLSDACADTEEEVHQFLVQKIFPKQAAVKTIEDWKCTL
ncbi:cysteine hydrolase family protein [Arachidicoccus soli]|uniref:Cysteine hydrolase n=1 Tax=Arachidicoccus soli TaxID=2341117 RepID=A0A386HSN8_9BACT|nr:isochorismatase family cysteine hydrolase [Arachidicoccus soli]AYD48420.1 cysteine hydrolase [Arachidicoccus soli]